MILPVSANTGNSRNAADVDLKVKNLVPIYYAHFAIAKENLWLRHVEPFEVIRRETRYQIQTQLFAAADREQAYTRALAMVDGFTDSHNDGLGDRTNFQCIGIYDLDEVLLFDRSMTDALNEPYGVDVGIIEFDDKAPTIPHRELLSIFSQSGS